METRPNNPACPVCKSVIDKEKLIPVYGRGPDGQKDPRFGLCLWSDGGRVLKTYSSLSLSLSGVEILSLQDLKVKEKRYLRRGTK